MSKCRVGTLGEALGLIKHPGACIGGCDEVSTLCQGARIASASATYFKKSGARLQTFSNRFVKPTEICRFVLGASLFRCRIVFRYRLRIHQAIRA